jgi:hypothetical protein
MYEMALNYPIEGVRKAYFDRQERHIDEDALLALDWDRDEIEKMKGK